MPIALEYSNQVDYSRLKKLSKFFFMNLPYAQFISFWGLSIQIMIKTIIIMDRSI